MKLGLSTGVAMTPGTSCQSTRVGGEGAKYDAWVHCNWHHTKFLHYLGLDELTRIRSCCQVVSRLCALQ
jgi:hypothetical protein